MKPTLTFETLELPVAELGPESSVPDLMGEKILQNQLTFDLEEGDDIHPGYGRVENSYPYRQFNTYTRTLTMQKVDTAVLKANQRPMTAAPRMNMITLEIITKVEMEMPSQCWPIRARPVVPPVISPQGRTNMSTARA